MNYHRKELAELIETTFRATEARLREEHHRDLRESQFQARQTHNAAALLPAEADSYIRHIKALTVARAQTIADAYTALSESSGEAGEKDLTNYYNTVLSARRGAFEGQSRLVARRTGMNLSQLPGLLRRFETESHSAMLEGRSILAKQRAAFRNPPSVPAHAAGGGHVELAKANASRVEDDDRRFAQMAIEEALRSVPEDDRPHPRVGAVVVKDGRVLAAAHRGEVSGCHAEYVALEMKLANTLVSGASVYTTLEPCTIRGHPKIPCAFRLVERRVGRVVIGMLDPNPAISGKGQRALRKGRIAIGSFPPDLMDQAEEMNREFTRVYEGGGDGVGPVTHGTHGAGHEPEAPVRATPAMTAARALTDATWDLQKAAWSFYALHTHHGVARTARAIVDEEKRIVEKMDGPFRVFTQDYDLPPALSAIATREIGSINIALVNLKAFSMTGQEADMKIAATQIQDACERIRAAARPYAYRSSS